MTVRINDRDVECHKDFRVCLVTSLPASSFTAEVTETFSIIDFTPGAQELAEHIQGLTTSLSVLLSIKQGLEAAVKNRGTIEMLSWEVNPGQLHGRQLASVLAPRSCTVIPICDDIYVGAVLRLEGGCSYSCSVVHVATVRCAHVIDPPSREAGIWQLEQVEGPARVQQVPISVRCTSRHCEGQEGNCVLHHTIAMYRAIRGSVRGKKEFWAASHDRNVPWLSSQCNTGSGSCF